VALRRLLGAALGLTGLVVGVVCFAVDLAPLGIAAGVLALAAGLVAHSAEARSAIGEARTDEVRKELERSRDELGALRTEVEEGRAAYASATDQLARERSDRQTEANQPAAIHSATDTRLLTDPETNLFSEAYFRVALDARIASARRHLRPVAVALVEVIEGLSEGERREADPLKVTGSIRQTLRDADTACRMSDGCFALILEDTPENGAVWTVERIRRNLTSRHGQHTMWAGVACYPAHAFSTDELLDQANLALESAREWKQDRIEIATAE